MENFTFYSPTKFAFGKDTENQAGKLVREFGGFVNLSSDDIAEIYKLAL